MKTATITELKNVGLPTNRRPTSPGEIIKEEFLKPLKLTQIQFSKIINIPYRYLNKIINGKVKITADCAL